MEKSCSRRQATDENIIRRRKFAILSDNWGKNSYCFIFDYSRLTSWNVLRQHNNWGTAQRLICHYYLFCLITRLKKAMGNRKFLSFNGTFDTLYEDISTSHCCRLYKLPIKIIVVQHSSFLYIWQWRVTELHTQNALLLFHWNRTRLAITLYVPFPSFLDILPFILRSWWNPRKASAGIPRRYYNAGFSDARMLSLTLRSSVCFQFSFPSYIFNF